MPWLFLCQNILGAYPPAKAGYIILFGKVHSIWLARYRIDFKKDHWSLLAEVYALGLDLLQGNMILFVSCDRRKLKLRGRAGGKTRPPFST